MRALVVAAVAVTIMFITCLAVGLAGSLHGARCWAEQHCSERSRVRRCLNDCVGASGSGSDTAGSVAQWQRA